MERHPELATPDMPLSLLMATAKHHETDPLDVDRTTWHLARKDMVLN